ncbi:MAG: ZIP family metal transporter [Spirochaetales bacterium]|nr:ZIP family metal transporter [Spirochaetales bacterium]MCP5485693.1 ZIP family metal transporter [Spirochaetales bacterium]
MTFVEGFHPVWQAFIAALFTYGTNALGAASVFMIRSVRRVLLDSMLGFAGGVMLAASFWSLLSPAMEMAAADGRSPWLVALSGFLLGGLALFLVNRALPHVHINYPAPKAEGPSSSYRRSTLLVIALTIHNIPEGLAVGVAFGALGAGVPSASVAGAFALAVGIGLQNFPEGMAVALPLRREGMSRWRSFHIGQLSGIVEPIAAVAGAALVLLVEPILPYALSFAAGAMIYVVIQEVIPEAQSNGNSEAATAGGMLGFALMMVLDVVFG